MVVFGLRISVCLLGTSGTWDIRENEFWDGSFVENVRLVALGHWDICDFFATLVEELYSLIGDRGLLGHFGFFCHFD